MRNEAESYRVAFHLFLQQISIPPTLRFLFLSFPSLSFLFLSFPLTDWLPACQSACSFACLVGLIELDINGTIIIIILNSSQDQTIGLVLVS